MQSLAVSVYIQTGPHVHHLTTTFTSRLCTSVQRWHSFCVNMASVLSCVILAFIQKWDLLQAAEFLFGWRCTFCREVVSVRYVWSPRLNIAGIQSVPLSRGHHSDWMITLLFSEMPVFIAYSPLAREKKNADKAHPSLLLYIAVKVGLHLIFLMSCRWKRTKNRHQLLFNICCKQEVSRGIHFPFPLLFSGCSQSSIVSHKHAFIHRV